MAGTEPPQYESPRVWQLVVDMKSLCNETDLNSLEVELTSKCEMLS